MHIEVYSFNLTKLKHHLGQQHTTNHHFTFKIKLVTFINIELSALSLQKLAFTCT